ncbi:MAG: hypothetical protein JSR77_16930 [Planctomycetes bacterium]|nr:hypothetical protein [Planctomycetota bacterium]
MAILSLVAVRLVQLKLVSRQSPDRPAAEAVPEAFTCVLALYRGGRTGRYTALAVRLSTTRVLPRGEVRRSAVERAGCAEVLLAELNHAGLFVAMQQHFGHVREFLDAHR